jgi:hypothetical protein
VSGLSRWSDRRATIAALVLAAAASALLAAGCGGGSSGPGVARIGSTSTSASSGSAPASNSRSPNAYSKCMRSHRVPLFPDPSSNGQISPGRGVDPRSPLLRKAQDACRPLLPKGGSYATAGSGAPLTSEQQAQLLRYAKCMRSHGVPTFPDPGAHGFALEPDQVDFKSPRFTSAQQACRSLLPKLGQGAKHTTGSGSAR